MKVEVEVINFRTFFSNTAFSSMYFPLNIVLAKFHTFKCIVFSLSECFLISLLTSFAIHGFIRNVLHSFKYFRDSPDVFLLADFKFSFIVARYQILYDFNPFTFIEAWFILSEYSLSESFFCVHLKRMCILLLLGS